MPASDPTEVPRNVPDDAVDELYGVPLDEFTPRRDALARDLRRNGERDAAAWVKALRKPTAAAWIVNQLARSRKRQAKELLRAADGLRAAHQRLMEGRADADALRSAAEAEQAAARALLRDADGFLDRDGHAPSDATLEKVAETIRAVALDDEARAGFALGRLTRERQASGFGPLGAAAKPAQRKARGRASRQKTASRSATRDRKGAARGETAAGKEALQKARAAQRERAQELRTAERELASAEREAERAVRRLERARADADRSRSRLAEAESLVAETESEVRPGGRR